MSLRRAPQSAGMPVRKHDAKLRVFTVRPTAARVQPSTDFMAMMRSSNMKDLGVAEGDYVLVKNIVIKDIMKWNCDPDSEYEGVTLKRFLGRLYGDVSKSGDAAISRDGDEMTISGGDRPPIRVSFSGMDAEELVGLVPELEGIIERGSQGDGDRSGDDPAAKGIRFTGMARCEIAGGRESADYLCRDNVRGERIITELMSLRIYAHLVGAEGRPLEDGGNQIGDGEVALDKTLREALGLEPGERVYVGKARGRFGAAERMQMALNYQKAVVRVQRNAPFMESRTPVCCICEEMMIFVGAKYGDMVTVEARDKKIRVRCVGLTPFMKEYHDSTIGHRMSRKEMDDLNKKYDATWIENPFNFLTRDGVVSRSYSELIHPIFMEQKARRALGVKPLEAVKVRRSLWWEVQKKINSFGGFAMLALAVLAPQLFTSHSAGDISSWSAAAALAPLIALIAWSVLTSSKYDV